jgi:hypothetical protein
MAVLNTLCILSAVIGITTLGMGIPAYLFHLFSPDSSVEHCMISGGVWFGLFMVLWGEYQGRSGAVSRKEWILMKERVTREQGHPFV